MAGREGRKEAGRDGRKEEVNKEVRGGWDNLETRKGRKQKASRRIQSRLPKLVI